MSLLDGAELARLVDCRKQLVNEGVTIIKPIMGVAFWKPEVEIAAEQVTVGAATTTQS